MPLSDPIVHEIHAIRASTMVPAQWCQRSLASAQHNGARDHLQARG